MANRRLKTKVELCQLVFAFADGGRHHVVLRSRTKSTKSRRRPSTLLMPLSSLKEWQKLEGKSELDGQLHADWLMMGNGKLDRCCKLSGPLI